MGCERRERLGMVMFGLRMEATLCVCMQGTSVCSNCSNVVYLILI